MTKFSVFMVVAGMCAGAGPAVAQADKQTTCMHQASVVGAVREARIARVKEPLVKSRVEARATWPESFNSAIPLVTPWIYEMNMRDVETQDLAAAWQEMCLAQ